jgi:hypothetical protein
MNEQDAAVIKVLTELGLRNDPKVRPEFEKLYPKDDPTEQFYDDVIKLFNENRAATLSGMPGHIEMMSMDILDQWAEEFEPLDVDLGIQTFASEDLMKKPIQLSYDIQTGKALIRDYRYADARDAGFTHVPVRVVKANLRGEGTEVPTPIRRMKGWRITLSDLGISES